MKSLLANAKTEDMAKSEITEAMDDVQASVRPFLRELGWRSRKRAFNRITQDGLTQVIEFQVGRFDPPGTHYVGFRRNFYGKFTVNVGVYVPEVNQCIGFRKDERLFVHEGDCCIRQRLGPLGPEEQDVWWELGDPPGVAAEILRRIERDAFPFFAQFESRGAILSKWTVETGNPYTGGNPPRVVCAIILAAQGRLDEARAYLNAQARDHKNHPHFAWVCALADKLGLGKLDL